MAMTGGHGTSGTNAANVSSSSSSNATSSLLFPRGPNSVSSLVRLALSSNFPGGLLSTAQSYPSLSNTLSSLSSVASHAVSMAGASSTNLHHGHAGVGQGHQQTSSSHGLSQALSMSLTGSSDSEQVSLEDFLESCRAGTLLAELEDDDELPEPDEDDNEDDDENEDDEDFEEVTEEDGAGGVGSLVGGAGDGSSASRHVTGNTKRRSWDDEFVLKRQFSALIPAFDPRPGRTNVHQTSDLEIPPPGAAEGAQGAEAVLSSSSSSSLIMASGQHQQHLQSDVEADADLVPQPKLHLVLRGPGLPNILDVEIELTDGDWTVFKAVQKLIQSSALGTRQEKLRRIWEPTYTVVYRELKDEAGAVVVGPSAGLNDPNGLGQRRLMDDELFLPDFDVNTQTSNTVGSCSVGDVLLLLRQLYILSSRPPGPGEQLEVEQQQLQHHQSHHSATIFIPLEEFSSKKVTNKLTQQLSDPLVVSAGALPAWCEQLLTVCPMLVPFETRQMYFQATAFGTSR